MNFALSVEGGLEPSVRRLEVRLSDGRMVVGRCDEAGSESYVTTDGQQVGWVEYGPRAPRAGHLVPQTTNPSWEAKLTLRERTGRLYQPHGSVFRARKRAIVVEVASVRYAYWEQWGRHRLEGDDPQQRLVFRLRKGVGEVEGVDPVEMIELFVLLSAAGVGRHLTALSA